VNSAARCSMAGPFSARGYNTTVIMRRQVVSRHNRRRNQGILRSLSDNGLRSGVSRLENIRAPSKFPLSARPFEAPSSSPLPFPLPRPLLLSR